MSIRRAACVYQPVDLNDPNLLAQDGLRALGRQSAVPPADGLRRGDDDDRAIRARARPRRALGAAPSTARRTRTSPEQFVHRLRIYPHALRDQQCLLQPGQEGAAVRLLPGRRIDGREQHAGHDWSSPASRTTSSRTRRRTPCSTASSTVQRAEQSRRARLPRGVRRHRRAVPAFLLSRGAARPDRAHARRPRQREPARPARAAVRPGHRPRRRAARALGRGSTGRRQVGAAARPTRAARTTRWSRTRAAPSWSRRSSTPSC